MAKVISAELEIKTGAAETDLKNLREGIEKVGDSALDTQKGFDKLEKETKTVSKGLKGMGTAFKALGVGLVIAAFDKLREVFNQNQQVVDFFNTTFEALSLAFNDFFNFLSSNVGTVIDYFKGLFQDPVQSLKNFGQAIVDNVIERITSALDALGYLGDAVVKVFKGDFAGAAESAKSAGKELFDVVTGVNDSFDKAAEALPAVVDGITNYTKSTIEAAKANVELQKSADLAIAKNQVILEQKDREAEKLRQIRDDESKTIEERIAANNKLADVLNEQERLMLANVDALVAAAQAQFDKNSNIENEIALIEAKGEREAILAQIEGFRSEQLMNINSLERERVDLIEESKEKEEERLEAIEDILEKEEQNAQEKLQIDKDNALAELELLEATEEQKQQIRERYAELEKELKKQVALENAEIVAEGLAGIAQLVGENTAFGKAVAVAQATIDTYAGANKALAQGGIFGTVSAIGIIAGGLANVQKILSTDIPNAPSGGGASTAAPQAPAFNIVGAAPENQLAQTIGEREDKPLKAFVVSSEVSSQQALDRNIEGSAALG